MNKKVLIIAHSYFMLLTAIQLKNTILKASEVDIIISDYSNNSKQVSDRLKHLNFFNSVIYAPVKKIYTGGNFVKKIRKIFLVFENQETVIKRFELDDKIYDEFLFSNYDIVSNQLFYILLKNNSKLKCKRFEEGYSTYTIKNDYHILEKFMWIVSKIFNKKLLTRNTDELFLYDPALYSQKGNYKLNKIPSLTRTDEKLKKIINYIFSYEDKKNDFNEKVIIFEESFYLEKEKILDIDLFEIIADKVGKDNIVVKLHPRNSEDRFTPKGYKVSKVNDVPWEVIQFNNDFSDKMLVTISSGSVINSKSFYQEHILSLVLYNCLKNPPRLIDSNFRLYIDKIKKRYGPDSLLIPETKKELEDIIHKFTG